MSAADRLSARQFFARGHESFPDSTRLPALTAYYHNQLKKYGIHP